MTVPPLLPVTRIPSNRLPETMLRPLLVPIVSFVASLMLIPAKFARAAVPTAFVPMKLPATVTFCVLKMSMPTPLFPEMTFSPFALVEMI